SDLATGLMVSDAKALQIQDIDFQLSVLKVTGKGRKERYIPFGEYAQQALEYYMKNGREQLLKNKKTVNGMFLNNRGNPLTTRGINYIFISMIRITYLNAHIQ